MLQVLIGYASATTTTGTFWAWGLLFLKDGQQVLRQGELSGFNLLKYHPLEEARKRANFIVHHQWPEEDPRAIKVAQEVLRNCGHEPDAETVEPKVADL